MRQFLGILGLIFIFFGLLTAGIIGEDIYYVIPTQFALGVLCLAVFALRGGLKHVNGAAVKRAAAFSFGLTLYSALFIGVIVLINFLAYKKELFQYDSTEQKVFTLAPQTEKVLSSLTHPLTITGIFLGANVPPETERLLERMQKASSHISWEKIDPEKNPQLIQKLGVNEAQTLHLSYEVNGTKREAKVVRDINEQELVNAILKVSREGPRIVYYSTGHGEGDFESETQNGFLFLKEAINGENIELRELTLNEKQEVPSDASCLLILAPEKELLEPELKAIEAYLQNGGNALLLNEPNKAKTVATLAAHAGIKVGNDVVVDQVIQLFSAPGLGVQPMVEDYGVHDITRDFTERTLFSTVSSVLPAEDSVNLSILARTSETSWAEKDIALLFSDEPQAAFEPQDIQGPVPIAVAFEGTLKKNGDKENKEGRVVVFGDTDFVSNLNIRQLYNRDFFLNALNWVVGEEEGVSIREKTLRQSLAALTPEQFSKLFLCTGIIFPELILIAGFFIWWRRKS